MHKLSRVSEFGYGREVAGSPTSPQLPTGARIVEVKRRNARPRNARARPTYADHRAQLKAIPCGWGMPEDNAEVTAGVLAWSDLHGVDSHGISMIPRCDELRRKGRVRMRRVASKFSTASILRCGAARFAG